MLVCLWDGKEVVLKYGGTKGIKITGEDKIPYAIDGLSFLSDGRYVFAQGRDEKYPLIAAWKPGTDATKFVPLVPVGIDQKNPDIQKGEVHRSSSHIAVDRNDNIYFITLSLGGSEKRPAFLFELVRYSNSGNPVFASFAVPDIQPSATDIYQHWDEDGVYVRGTYGQGMMRVVRMDGRNLVAGSSSIFFSVLSKGLGKFAGAEFISRTKLVFCTYSRDEPGGKSLIREMFLFDAESKRYYSLALTLAHDHNSEPDGGFSPYVVSPNVVFSPDGQNIIVHGQRRDDNSDVLIRFQILDR